MNKCVYQLTSFVSVELCISWYSINHRNIDHHYNQRKVHVGYIVSVNINEVGVYHFSPTRAYLSRFSFFLFSLTSLSRLFTQIETSQSEGGAKREYPGKTT